MVDVTAYPILIRPLSADEGDGYLASIPALPGCHGDGATELEAIQDVREAAKGFIAMLIEQGDPVPLPEKRSA